ncbi:MAG TPA: carbohydrate ABC transporter permease [Candidatus Limnocylindrales bacterium]|nr:carbohydrate ABC transporter permease [Candidatus Limnocylindrales bacterium]
MAVNREESAMLRGRFGGPARSVGAFFVLLVFVPPLLLLVSGSFQTPGRPPSQTPELIPRPATAVGYELAFEWGGLLRATLNSLIVAAIAVPLSVLVASAAGFAITLLSRRARIVVIGLSVAALMVPSTALLVPRFALFRWAGLTNTFVPLVSPALIGMSPLYVLAFYLAFRAIPRDLYDACLIEDLTPARIWWRVAMPQVRPVTSAIAALAFVTTWSNFLDPLVFVYDRDLFTLPLALRSLAALDPTDFPIFLAGAVFATLPAVVVYSIAQRRFLQ